MATLQREAKIVNKYGLHARPAMQFVAKGPLVVDAKSIMSVMRLAATKGTVLKLVADGEDAEPAIEALVKLVEEGFGEE